MTPIKINGGLLMGGLSAINNYHPKYKNAIRKIHNKTDCALYYKYSEAELKVALMEIRELINKALDENKEKCYKSIEKLSLK